MKLRTIAVAAAAAALCSASPALGAGYSLERQWGDETLDGPQAVATDAAGNVYVTYTREHRVEKFNASGRSLARWGTEGSGAGELSSPGEIATDPAGHVYVADSGNARLQKFTATGRFVAQVGGLGAIGSLATDTAGNVYVSVVGDAGERIKKLDPAGRPLAEWASPVEVSISGLAVDPAGNVYVGDGQTGVIVKLDARGQRVTEWDARAPTELMTGPGLHDLATDASGAVYATACATKIGADWISAHFTRSVRKFSGSGALITDWVTDQRTDPWAFFFGGSWQCSGGGGANAFSPQAEFVATDASGKVYVSGISGRIQKFTAS